MNGRNQSNTQLLQLTSKLDNSVGKQLLLLLILGWLLYGILYYLKFQTTFQLNWFIRNYCTDLLCIPLVLGSALLLIRLIKKNALIRLNLIQVSVGIIYFSVIFEWALPLYKTSFTGDIWDVVCYVGGGGIFFWAQKNPFENSNRSLS